MKHFQLENMVRGWFVGNFFPSAFTTNSCEVGIKMYKKGDYEKEHFHKIATEITVLVSGSVRMCNQEWNSGDIVVVEPGESTDFTALSDALTVVVKVPGVLDDKYISEGLMVKLGAPRDDN